MTGVGERIMVLLSAKRLADLVADGRTAEDAAAAVMAELDRGERRGRAHRAGRRRDDGRA